MSNITSFILGSVFGAYIAQNYDIPKVQDKIEELKKYMETLEKKK